jgi:hypothetical protein
MHIDDFDFAAIRPSMNRWCENWPPAPSSPVNATSFSSAVRE